MFAGDFFYYFRLPQFRQLSSLLFSDTVSMVEDDAVFYLVFTSLLA